MQFIDLVQIAVQAGHGGDGVVAFPSGKICAGGWSGRWGWGPRWRRDSGGRRQLANPAGFQVQALFYGW